MSSMSSGLRPTRYGLRYSSTAVTTASGRWGKVAQPSPYRPGSLVSTLTTTRRMPSGAVQMAFTLVIRIGGSVVDGSHGGRIAGSTASGWIVRDIRSALLGRGGQGLPGRRRRAGHPGSDGKQPSGVRLRAQVVVAEPDAGGGDVERRAVRAAERATGGA